jgi:hypothetical protein
VQTRCTVFNIVPKFGDEMCVQAGTTEVTFVHFAQGKFNNLRVGPYNMAYLIDFYCLFVFLVSFHSVNMTINS